MIRAEASAIIDVPVEKVWEFMSDLGTMVQWNPGVLKVEFPPPAGVGSVAVITAKSLWKTSTVEIKEWEPNRKFRFQGKLVGAKVNLTCTMESIEENRTKLSRTAEIEADRLLRLLSPFTSHRTNRALSGQVENIKHIMEAQRSQQRN